MIVTLIRIDAQDAAGTALPVRLASHDLPECCHLGGEQWEPALSQLPDFALDFFGGGFSGQVTAPRTGFSVATIGMAAFGAVPSARARFADARVRIWVGDITSAAVLDLGPLTLRFDGRIAGEPEVDDATRTARFDAAVQDSWADKPLLALFAGTGGIEGPADLTGQPEPLALGNLRFAGGVLIDQVDNVWAVSTGSVQAVNAVYDRLTSLGTSTGNFANLAALKAASIPNGSWATCLAQGLVRLGAPPDGRVSFDVSGSNTGTGGYVRQPGAIIRRIADLAGGTVNAASLTALDTARPYNLHLQLREQITAREVIARIADSVGAAAGVSLTGQLFAQALTIGTSGEVLNADDSSAQRVVSVEELAKSAPNWRLATEAELTIELHSADEAAFSYRWQGEYSATRVYRVDDVVTGLDSASWAYINPTASSGNSPPIWPVTSNAFWSNIAPPSSGDLIGSIVAPANANRVPFSQFENASAWYVSAVSGTTASALAIAISGGIPTLTFTATAGAAGNFGSFKSARFRVQGGERLSCQARMSTNIRSECRVTIRYFDASNTPIGAQPEVMPFAGIGTPSQYLFQGFTVAPSNAVAGEIEAFVPATSGGALSASFSQPMITSAAADQTVHPSFSPGPNATDGADPNNLILIDGGGFISGIGTANISVDNRRAALQGLLSARPASGQFIGQEYHATDTREIFQWDGFNWRASADITATAQRSIEPQFPSIEIKQGEAGHTGNRTVTHVAKKATTTITGGTWSLPSVNLGAGSATINSSTGTVTLSGIVQSGAYAVRYTHTDGLLTDLAVNVTYVPTPAGGGGGAKTGRTTSSAGTSGAGWQTIATLTITSAPAGRVGFGGFERLSYLEPTTGTGTADFEARLRLNGTTNLKTVASQNVVSGGVISFADFAPLFTDTHAVSAGTLTFTIELQRTSGTGNITATNTALEAQILAT